MTVPADDQSLRPGTVSDAFLIEATLLVDEEGNTYRARDRHTDRPVLIREYLPRRIAHRDPASLLVVPRSDDLADRYERGLAEFLRTARAWAQLDNPHLVRVTQYMEDAGTGYIVMDDEAGHTLDQLLPKRYGPPPEAEVMELFTALLDGLQEVHAVQLVHGNIHPGSVLVRDSGAPLLIEFSTALRDPASDDASPLARLCPGYVPIEQYSVHSALGTRTDIYSLGATLYRYITGVRPADARERVAAITQERDDSLVSIHQVANGGYRAGLLDCIDHMLRPFDYERPESVDAVLAMLRGTQLDAEQPLDTDTEIRNAEKRPRSEPPLTPTLPVPAGSEERRRVVTASKRSLRSGVWMTGLGVIVAALAATWWWSGSQPRVASSDGDRASVVSRDAESTVSVDRAAPFRRGDDDKRVAAYRRTYEDVQGRDRQAEIDRAVSARLAALEAQREQSQADRIAEQAAARQAEIARLIAAGDTAMAEQRDVSPPGVNALGYFRQALQLEPDHPAAKQRLTDLAEKYLQSGRQAIDNGALRDAHRALDTAARIDATHDGVRELRQALIVTHIEQERVMLAETQRAIDDDARAKKDAEVARLISAAEEAELAGHWITPAGRSAVHYYRQALSLAPDNAVALAGLAAVARRYFDLAAASLAADQLDAARGYAVAGSAIEPSNERGTTLFQRIDARQRVNEQPTQARSPAAPPQPVGDAPELAGVTPAATVATGEPSPTDAALQRGLAAFYAGRYGAAYTEFRPLAEQGIPRAQFRLAVIYHAGQGVAKNPPAVQEWLRKAAPGVREAARNQEAWAQSDLGRMYEEGWLVQQDHATAADWYQRAADQGDPGAQNNLAILYDRGLGVTKDRAKVVEWLRKAADQGHLVAQQNLRQLGVN